MSPITARISGPRNSAALGPLDQRLAAWRNDRAELTLAPLIAVPHFVAPVGMHAVTSAAMLEAPHTEATPISEILPGEGFALLDTSHGYAWGYNTTDHYVGYVPLAALQRPQAPATHMIGPGDALVFAAPDIKSAVIATLPAGSRVRRTTWEAVRR